MDGWITFMMWLPTSRRIFLDPNELTGEKVSTHGFYLSTSAWKEFSFFFFLDIDCGSGFAEAWTFYFICLQRRDTPVIGYPHLVVVVAFLALLLARTFQGLLNNEMNEKKSR
jgi:hypothetical protein